MSLTTPILNNVPAWDKSDGQVFTFNVIGGDIVQGNELTIIQDSNNTVVYQVTQTTYQYKHTVPSTGTNLQNGVLYRAYIKTYNGANWSTESNVILFYCFVNPTFQLTISDAIGGVINTSYVTPTIYYTQSNGEAISDYRFLLYDVASNLISQSNVIYTGLANTIGSIFGYDTTYMFQGLEDNTTYLIKAVGHTTGGTYIETASVSFSVQYTNPEEYNLLYLENNCNGGYINYRSMAYVIGGTSYPSSPVYTTNGINLRSNSSYVEWNSGFVVPEDFTVKAWVQQPNLNTVLFTMYKDSSNYIKVSYIEDPLDNSKGIITLEVIINSASTYFIYSNSFTKPTSTKTLCIQIRSIGDIYDVIAEVLG